MESNATFQWYSVIYWHISFSVRPLGIVLLRSHLNYGTPHTPAVSLYSSVPVTQSHHVLKYLMKYSSPKINSLDLYYVPL
jgi:hypothetical protein